MTVATDVKIYYPYINGEFVKTDTVREIVNPYDNSVVGKVHFVDASMARACVSHGANGFEKMRKMPPHRRAEILENIAKGIAANHKEIAETLAQEAGKPLKQAKGETSRAIITFRTAAEEAKRINGEILPLEWDSSAMGRTGFVRRFPIGVIFGITPFNFPLNLAAHKIAPALASGNSIIIKPASKDPISTLWIARLAQEAGIPPGALQIIPASPDAVNPIIEDSRVKMITFTGSAEVGWNLKSRAGKKRVALELGGNGGVIVEKDCDLDYARKRILMGGFSYAGQVCISVQRVYIHKDIYEDFVKSLVASMEREVKVGAPLDENVTLSAMISLDEAKRVEKWVVKAVEGGAKILTGGNREGSVMYPTILSDATRDMEVCCNEVFGPVITVEPYDTFEEAVGKLNDTRYGLQAGIFTNNLEKAMTAFDEIETGGVMINDVPTFRIDPMPYGGIKDSGMGREGLRYAMEEMTEPKLMVINRSSN